MAMLLWNRMLPSFAARRQFSRLVASNATRAFPSSIEACPSRRCFAQKSGSDHHAFFQQQMQELDQERKSFLEDINQKSGSEHHGFFQQQLEELESERKSFFGESKDHSNQADLVETANQLHSTIPTSASANSPTDVDDVSEIDMEELHAEREALFQFSDEEKKAWGKNSQNLSQTVISADMMLEIERARAEAAAQEDKEKNNDGATTSMAGQPASSTESTPFTHLSQDGKSVHMVDVGAKEVTTRMAKAQTKVILPVEVLQAFDLSPNAQELVGKKGPIFSTAKLAGIMAAKKTSDLIPLCHPLPLDQVQVDIFMENASIIVVECTCRVTHKTGVEMEALTGASVAALCIYDMVKAVSHQVEITSTKLISKTGGKRNIDHGKSLTNQEN
mmetsp:Transcript_16490/g.47819  ORF Transcript_16490/g.47819 Transcript_16490/m.47819 type:complete len:390 (+) Transcript_16490:147-1316(+)